MIQLGFRVINVQPPNCSAIIPCISAMRLQTADGEELRPKKVGVAEPARALRWLHLRPGVSQSLAEPALLAHAGAALALTWADSNGDVWQIDGLRPGRYTLRYLLEAQKGKTREDWTSWTGAVPAAAVDVEIK
jgi:hypothetical protein